MKKDNYKKLAIDTLGEITKQFPTQLLSTHISIAFSDYLTIDGISDKELYFLLEKYRCEKELDIATQHDSSIDLIIKESKNLDINSLYEDEEDFE